MALPQNRQQFKEYILRRLGAPVIKINVSDDQVEDRIDDAMSMWSDYHYDGSEKIYLAHRITNTDKTNKYVTLEDKTIGITRMFPMSTMLGSQNLFSLTYQFAQSDFLSSALTGSLVPYWMAMQHIEFVQQVLIGIQPVRFNRHTNRVYIDMAWDRVSTDDYIVLEGYKKLTPEDYPDIWQDRWLLRYATALVKRQWGEQLKKYGTMTMAGGTVFNGQVIFDEAAAEIEKLEKEMITDYSAPVEIMFG